jgi:sugar/nucleoside kinase (ribokinase family)
MTPRLVSVGNIIVDLTVTIDALPERGGDVVGDSHGAAAGGSFNTMVAAARQGLTTAYGGAHGTGPFGDLVRAALAAEGVVALGEPTPDRDTGFDVALIDAHGERTFVTVFGAEATLTRHALEGIRVSSGDFVHVSGYGLLERTNGRVLAPWIEALAPGATVLFDPGPLAGDIPAAVMAHVASRADWLSCNLREARILTGATDESSAAVALLERFANVVVRLSEHGCLVATRDGSTLVPGFDVDVVDTNGAGDAHAGAFLAALSRGEAPERAALFANAAAALAVTRRGPATAPRFDEVAEFVG